jgi:hypothetical protein
MIAAKEAEIADLRSYCNCRCECYMALEGDLDYWRFLRSRADGE